MKKWENISDWFLEKEDSDVEIHAETETGDEVIFPGHGFVLTKISTVLKTMLGSGKFQEGETKIIKLKIQGDQSDALTFVRWFYTKDLKKCDEKSYVALMKTAHMYDVKELFDNVEENLSTRLNSKSICKLYCSLNNVASKGFLAQCKDFMKNSATYIFLNNLHITLDEEAVAILVQSGTHEADDEENILDALWYWIQAKCLFKRENHEEKSERVMTRLVRNRRWQNLQEFNKEKPWYGLIKELAEVAPKIEQKRVPPPPKPNTIILENQTEIGRATAHSSHSSTSILWKERQYSARKKTLTTKTKCVEGEN